MTEAQRDAIPSPAEGLVIYNLDENCLNFHNKTNWVSLCSKAAPDPLPGNITLTAGQIGYIASVYDENYLPYTSATAVASTGSIDADGASETLVDIQGVLTTTGISISIPYTVTTAQVSLPAFSETKTVISDHIQGSNAASNDGGGTAIDVEFSYDAATLDVGTGTITATIKALGSDLNAVKLDINSGIGTDIGILLAEFTIATDATGGSGTIQLKDIPGIPDRRFGDETTQNGIAGQYHNNLYLPVKYNGKIWLNHNLGANYADVSHPDFNLAKEITSVGDTNAYGSNYQWGRYSDGHELWTVNPAFPKTGIFLNTPITTVNQQLTLPTDASNQFINGNSRSPQNWLHPPVQELWQGVNGVNNPCPEGFRVPTIKEWDGVDIALVAISDDGINTSISTPLKLSASGYSNFSGDAINSLSTTGTGDYWSSNTVRTSPSSTTASWMHTFSTTATSDSAYQARSYGASIRCVQDDPSSPTALPGNVSLTAGQIMSIASVYDNDYLPYSVPTSVADTGTSNADGSTETLVDIQGVLNTTTGITVRIPYTVTTASVDLPAFSQTRTVISDHIQGSNPTSTIGGGAAVDVTLSYDAITLPVGFGFITATIKAVDNDLNAVKLDINKGIGTDIGILLAEFTIATNSTGGTGTVQLKDVAGIPDRRFGEQTNQGGSLGNYHDNLYVPVVAEDGRTWLNHQLGAIYTRTLNYDGNPNVDFNPAATPSSLTDYKAYGNYFQWGRYSDGHELLTFKLAPTGGTYLTSGSGVYYDEINSTKNTKETTTDKTLTSNQFVTLTTGTWHNSPSTTETLWTGENAPNNPCPQGFRVPTHAEYQTLRSSIDWTPLTQSSPINDKNNHFMNTSIKWVFSGHRSINSYFFGDYHTTTNGYVFAGTSDQSSTNNAGVSHIYINTNSYWPAISPGSPQNNKGNGYTIRCIQHIEAPSPIPADMTLSGNKVSYVASINDDDYLPYITPSGPAQLGPKVADGNTTETAINIQGTLTTTGQTIDIPYSVSSGTPVYEAYSFTVTVDDSLTEDGNGRQVNFSYPGGTANGSGGTIQMTIKSIGGDLLLKKLDLVNGLGDGTSIEGNLTSNVFGILVAEVPILINSANDTNYIQLRNVSGIPDRRFGETTSQGNATGNYHDNLYLPVAAKDGKVWLNHYLGANYSDITHGSFNLSQIPSSYTDHNAYGNLFQWGRYSDGHELRDFTGPTSVSFINGTTNATSSTDSYGHNDTYLTSGGADWRSPKNDNLWQGENGINNPCPYGYKVPSQSTIDNLYAEEGISNLNHAIASPLKFTASGFHRDAHYQQSTISYLWSSTATGSSSGSVYLRANDSGSGSDARGHSFPIRCVKHKEEPALIPANMTLEGDKVSYVASIIDTDYLPFTQPTSPAKLAVKSADNSDETTPVNIQGVLTTTGKTMNIPFTVSGSVNYEGYSYTVSVHDSLTEDGNGRDVNFSYPGGSVSANGNITMTIKAIDGDLLLKKLDINNGVGDGTSIEGSLSTGVYGVLIAEVPIYIDDANTLKHIQLRNVAGIPDRRYGEQTKTGATNLSDGTLGFNHNNLYIPIEDASGRLWLNNNLGADYSDVNHPDFNPVQQATARDDYRAYGSHFQWGRYSDGHELVNYINSSEGNAANGRIDARSSTNSPGNSLFYNPIPLGGSADWTNSTDTDAWTGLNGTNNPCPHGFKVPDGQDYLNFRNNEVPTITNSQKAFESFLKLTTAGQRAGSIASVDSEGNADAMFLWASENGTTTGNANHVQGYSSNFIIGDHSKYAGHPVRCIQHVNQPLPANITLTAGQKAYIASVYDENYLPYTTATAVAATGSVDADGTTETLIDIQGTLNTTTGLTVQIPYTVTTASVNLPAFSETKTVISDHIQGSTSASNIGGGTPVDVEFSYNAQTLAVGSGFITAKIKAVTNDLNAVKLDINSGIGTDIGLLLAEFTIETDALGGTGTIQLRDIPGIPDRRFGETTTQGTPGVSGQFHNNLYLPLEVDGRIWLNNNLGADYADASHPNFNLAQQATLHSDKNAYGSLYQWGRYSDGHELMEYSTSTSGGRINTGTSSSTINSDTPANSDFITQSSGDYDWRSPKNDNLWQGENGINNPCPDGFRLPNQTELSDAISHLQITNYTEAASSALAFSLPGYNLHNTGALEAPSGSGYYLTSTIGTGSEPHRTSRTLISTNGIFVANSTRASGFSVRCIQHVQTPSSIPASMTLSGNKVSYIASISDDDYLPYSVPTSPAKLDGIAAGSGTETNIDIQGVLSTTGQTIAIPYTSTGSPNYDAYSYTISVHDSLTEDGIGRNINFSYPSGTADAKGAITMTIKSLGGNLNLKKLDINTGLGDGTSIEGSLNSGVFGVLVAEVPIYIDDANTTEYIQLRNTSGIPDRRFGESTNISGSTDTYHNFIYLPIVDNVGRIWLNNNLGANYANTNNIAFNPAQHATARNDFNAAGSLYQWGRYSDGHELISRTSTTGSSHTPLNTTIGTYTNTITPNNSIFYKGDETISRRNWVSIGNPADFNEPTESGLWQGADGPNNPCPQGFRVPTFHEFNALKMPGYTNNTSLPISPNFLNLSVPGIRLHSPSPDHEVLSILQFGHQGHYWTQTQNNGHSNHSWTIYFQSESWHYNNTYNYTDFRKSRASGLSVRCIQNI